jgi:glucokinase
VAISFAFPGPADYELGIIGDLPNLPAFRGGVALGPMLESHFKMPVFINNDGSLFAFGEAIAGFLPYVNNLLESHESPKRYKNLVGFTLGTGFGCGIVMNGELVVGDNSIGAEAWLLRDVFNPETNVEESISIRAVRRVYAELSGMEIEDTPQPKEIYEIAAGHLKGDRDAALHAYARMGQALGEAIATVLTLVDGIAVLGGGISAAFPAFIESAVATMNGSFNKPDGEKISRLAMKIFNLQDPLELDHFIRGDSREISVPGSGQGLLYDPMARSGLGVTRLGTSEAIAVGAYAFALNNLT